MHAVQVLNSLAQLRRNGTLCDVLLQPELESAAAASEASRGVWAHRAVLAAASPYFLAMFTMFSERTETVVTIKGVEPAALRAVVEYIYSPESLSVTEDNAQSLLSAASMLAVDGVRDEIGLFLEHSLVVDNAIGIRAFAEQHACAALAAAATRFVNDYYEEVLKCDELLELSADALAELLDILTVSAEEHVLNAVLRWTQHLPEERRQYLAELLQRVRLPMVPLEILSESAQTEPLASAELPVKDLVIKAFAFHGQRPDRREDVAVTSMWYRPRKTPAAVAMLVMGGRTNTGPTNEVVFWKLSSCSWQAAAALPVPRYAAGAAVINGRVYVVGGHDDRSALSTVAIYDVATDSWTAGPALSAARYDLGMATLGGVLYVAGGWDNAGRVFRSAEALDPREGVWRSIADMSSSRVCVGVGALGGQLYAAGGYNASEYLDTVERYDPVADRWQAAECMSGRRSGAGAGVVDNVLYMVGGRDRSTRFRSAERYRPGAGWQAAPDMTAVRSAPAVVTHAGRLYAAGGWDDSGDHLSSVAVFEPATGTWSELPAALPAGRRSAAAAVIDWPSAAL